jgi:hypothetical protein
MPTPQRLSGSSLPYQLTEPLVCELLYSYAVAEAGVRLSW